MTREMLVNRKCVLQNNDVKKPSLSHPSTLGCSHLRQKAAELARGKRQEIYHGSKNTYAMWYACTHTCSLCKKSRELFNKNVQMVETSFFGNMLDYTPLNGQSKVLKNLKTTSFIFLHSSDPRLANISLCRHLFNPSEIEWSTKRPLKKCKAINFVRQQVRMPAVVMLVCAIKDGSQVLLGVA
uniref:Uncharacterized protein n=1 Tax=Glossina pallidipes TaxID=7398 RepID=A0A1B0AEJ0_GLOPL